MRTDQRTFVRDSLRLEREVVNQPHALDGDRAQTEGGCPDRRSRTGNDRI
jgi:hypothetical protein